MEGNPNAENVQPHEVRSISDLEVGPCIGKGHTSKCYMARLRGSKPWGLAVKAIDRSRIIGKKRIEHIFAEKAALTALAEAPNPFFLTFVCTLKDDTQLYFVTSIIHGEHIYESLRKQPRGYFSEATAKYFACEIITAIEHLHGLDYMHRDINASNVMLCKTGHCKLIDLGFARSISKDCRANTFCGTPHAMAPEIILGKSYDKRVDWWSFGVLLYEMLHGHPPTGKRQGTDAQEFIVAGFPDEVFASTHLRGEAQSSLREILKIKTDERAASRETIGRLCFFRDMCWDDVESMRCKPPYLPECVWLKTCEDENDTLTEEQQQLFSGF